MNLGRVGVWSGQFRSEDQGEAHEAAAELEELGFGTLWIPGGAGGDILDIIERALGATSTMVLATGILNVWMHEAQDVASRHAELTASHPDRFLLGLGVSHALLIDHVGGDRKYEKPLSVMVDYLDQLDRTDPPVPTGERMLAALGPKMLELSRDRTLGAHPYCVSPAHTAYAREILGDGPILAPELKVVLSGDPEAARATARAGLAIYLRLPNYTNNLLRTGFTEADFEDGGSDRLVDEVVAWGSLEVIADRIAAHRSAGADHVCVQVLTDDAANYPRAEWREVATILSSVA